MTRMRAGRPSEAEAWSGWAAPGVHRARRPGAWALSAATSQKWQVRPVRVFSPPRGPGYPDRTGIPGPDARQGREGLL